MSYFSVSTSIPSPYDISILILIYLHTFGPKPVPLRLFIRLISSSSIRSTQFNNITRQRTFQSSEQEPLPPLLENILKHLLDHSPDNLEICFGLCKSLQSITSFDQLLMLKSILEDKYHSVGITYLANFVKVTSAKFDSSTFDDRTILLTNLKNFINNSEWVKKYDVKIRYYSFDFTGKIKKEYKALNFNNIYLESENCHYTDSIMIDRFKSFIEKNTAPEVAIRLHNTVILSEIHLQNIINYQIEATIRNEREEVDDHKYKLINQYLDNLSLSEVTKFPSIHILNYFRYVQEKRYQDALDSLHTYYDYMLARNTDQNFHIALLHLALFHLTFNDSKSPLATLEEAFKIARDNRDLKTLNYIHLSVLQYMEDYPKQIISIKNQIIKIINNLQHINGQNNSQIFEGAYRADAVLSFKDNRNLVKLLETSFQYFIISLQQDQLTLLDNGGKGNIFSFFSKMWQNLGYNDISSMYGIFYEKDPIDLEIEKGIQLLKDGKNIDSILDNLSLPSLKYDQEMALRLLSIRNLISCKEFDQAFNTLDHCIDESINYYHDNYWKFQYTLESIQLFIDVGMGQRVLTKLSKLMNETYENKNSLQSAQCLLLLCQTLYQLNKIDEVYKLLHADLDLLLQFDEIKKDAVKLFITVADSLMMT